MSEVRLGEETLTATPMKRMPSVVMFRTAAVTAELFCCIAARGIKRPPYCAIPTWILPNGSGPR